MVDGETGEVFEYDDDYSEAESFNMGTSDILRDHDDVEDNYLAHSARNNFDRFYLRVPPGRSGQRFPNRSSNTNTSESKGNLKWDQSLYIVWPLLFQKFYFTKPINKIFIEFLDF